MSEDAKTRIKRGRSKLILSEPFYAVLSLRLQVVEDKKASTAWTDGKRFGYNPDFIMSLTDAEIIGVWVHEVMHNAMGHMVRRANRYMRKWNIAGDYAINSIIRQKFSLPKGVLYDPRFNGKNAETIYDLLPGVPEQGKDQGDPNSGSGNDPQSTDPGRCGEVRDAESPNETSNEWKVAVAQAVAAAKGIGNLPGDLAAAIDKILRDPLPWQEMLRRFVDQTAKTDYRWCPPNRRHIAQGLYLPSIIGDELRNIVVAVDSSGSVSDQALGRFGVRSKASCSNSKHS